MKTSLLSIFTLGLSFIAFSQNDHSSYLSGNWQGTLTDHSTGIVKNVEVVIDEQGYIVDVVGLAGPFSGNIEESNGYIQGRITTGEKLNYSEIQLELGERMGNTISGTYSLNCSDCSRGEFLLTNMSTGLEEFSKVSLDVYPNPVQDELFVVLDQLNSSNIKVSIVNLLGKQVYSNNFNGLTSKSTLKIQNEGWESGLYMLQISTYNQTSTKQFYVE